jgi:striatin 1/3/4
MLASASADGTVKIWDTRDTAAPERRLLCTLRDDASGGKLWAPTAVDWVRTGGGGKLAVAYQNARIAVWDVVTGKVVVRMKSDTTFGEIQSILFLKIFFCLRLFVCFFVLYLITFIYLFFIPKDGSINTQINSIVCHPTLPLIISAHEDRYIRYFDINTGM